MLTPTLMSLGLAYGILNGSLGWDKSLGIGDMTERWRVFETPEARERRDDEGAEKSSIPAMTEERRHSPMHATRDRLRRISTFNSFAASAGP